jgi:4'-phosphopantetheinyl transferase EntD
LSGLLARLLRPGMFGAEMADQGQLLVLHPEEERHVTGAADKRRRDFILGRACAHAALAQLGRDEGAVGKAGHGAPLWPAGVTGSITHTAGYAAAVVAPADGYAGLGLDAERIGGVGEQLWPRLFDEGERAALSGVDAALLATLFFSAKEAAYKAWDKRSLGFRDIHIARTDGGFTAAHDGEMLHGQYATEGDLILTLVWR